MPEGAPIREYQKAARELYRKLQKTPAQREDLGEIRFTKAGWSEAARTGADPRKWRLFPKLKEIIEGAAYIERHELRKQRKDNIIAFHWLETDVALGGENLRVGMQIAEDADGNKFYNLNQDLEGWSQKYEAPGADPALSDAGPQELRQNATAPVENRIVPDADSVNLHILPQEGGQGGPVVRGSVTLSPESAAARIFKGANLSTIPHESAHIFLDDLMRVAADDGSIALGNMRRSLADALKGEAPAVRRTVDALLADAVKSPAETRIASLRTAVAELRAHARDARAASRAHAAAVEDLQRQAREKGETFQPGQTPPWFDHQAARILSRDHASANARAANIVSRAVGHLHALDQARADLRALRQWAQVPVEGELAQGSEEWTKFHETVALGFEQYLREGRAPAASWKRPSPACVPGC